MIWSLLLYYPSTQSAPAVSQRSVAREQSLGSKGPSTISPHTSVKSKSCPQAFPEMAQQKSFRPPTAAVFSRPETRRSLRGMAKRRDVILATFCLAEACSHPQRPKKQQFGSWAQVGRRAWKAGVWTGELILMVIAWWWPLHSNDIWKAVMKWCRSLSEFCFLACAGKR